MSRHLLPKNKGVINVVTSGQWVDFTDDFNRFQSNIEIPERARINVTSIPSPWARMLLFKEAIMSSKHMLHREVMSNILNVIEIIYYHILMDFKLEVRDIHLNGQNLEPDFHDILYKLYPEDLEGKDVIISLLLATRKDETFVLAGTSPFTMFFTPLELTVSGKIPRYFKPESVSLDRRPAEFQSWLLQIFIPKLINKGIYRDLVNAFAFPDGICSQSNPAPIDNRDYTPCDLFDNNAVLKDLFDHAKHCLITSPNLLTIRDEDKRAPLVFDTAINMTGRPYYNDYSFAKNFSRSELADMDRSVLPGEVIRYPWLLPYVDFLEPCIIRYRYDVNKDVMITGNGSDVFKYLLPLSSRFFEYFTLDDVDSMICIVDDGANSVRVKLKIQLQDGQYKVIERRYTGYWSDTRREDCIIEYDEQDISTPLPHIVFWPKIHPDVWKEPYYCMIYSERYNSQHRELISLQYKDKDNKAISSSSARKSKAVDVVKLDNLPTYIAIEDISKHTTGYLILDHRRLPQFELHTDNTKVGLDFGTSHTNVAIKIDGHTEILTYNSHYNGSNLNCEDFINTIGFTDAQMTTDNIPDLLKANLSQYLYPNRLGMDNSKDEANFPMPTMVVKEDNAPEPTPLLHYSINFSKSNLYPYLENAKPINKSTSTMNDLKWNHDINSQNASEAYLRVLLTLLRCELIKRRVDPNSAKYFWAYPRSFSRVDTDRYDNMWRRMLSGLSVSKTDESKAALLYFDHNGTVSSNNPGMVIIADVGGGSSDVSVWHNQDIRLLTSSLWAGRDLAGYRDDQSFYSILLDTLKAEFPKVADQFIRSNDPQMCLNYILYSLTDDTLAQYALSNPFYKVRFLIIYFFSTLFYEIGLQCRRFKDDTINSVDVCLAGNGSRFASWCGNNGSISDLDADIYKDVLRISMGLGEKIKINLQTSQAKKCEVAVGLCEGREELFNKEAEFAPIIAESVSIQGNKLSPDEIITEFDETHRENAKNLILSESDSELVKFHEVLFDVLEKSDLYRHGLNADPALNDLDEIKTELLGDWNNLVGQIRTMAGDNIQNLSSISSSLFILGMKATIRRLHKYLSQV